MYVYVGLSHLFTHNRDLSHAKEIHSHTKRDLFTHKKTPFQTQIRVKKRVITAMQLLMITCMREGLRVCAYHYTYIYD